MNKLKEDLTQPIGGVIARPLLMAAAPLNSVVAMTMLLRDGAIAKMIDDSSNKDTTSIS
jgi:hypothetical protein